MREAFWAAECLRLLTLIVAVSLGTRFVLWASGEEGVVAVVLRVGVICTAAIALGYL